MNRVGQSHCEVLKQHHEQEFIEFEHPGLIC